MSAALDCWLMLCPLSFTLLVAMSKMTLNDRMIVERYPKANELIGNSIPNCDNFPLLDGKKLLGGYAPHMLPKYSHAFSYRFHIIWNFTLVNNHPCSQNHWLQSKRERQMMVSKGTQWSMKSSQGPVKICDWLLNSSHDHFGLHQGKKCQSDHGVRGP